MATLYSSIRKHFDLRIDDDRGEPRAITVRLQQGRGASRTRFDPLVHRFARTGFRHVAIWSGLSALIGIALLAGLVLTLIGWASIRMGFANAYTVSGVALLGLGVTVLAIAVPRRRRSDRRRLASAIVRFGICPHCVYSLDGASVREDGCVLCPECGSAWRRDRIARFSEHPFEHKIERVGPAIRRACAVMGGWRWTRDDRDERVPLFSRTLLATVDPEHPLETRRDTAERLWTCMTTDGGPLRWTLGIVIGLAIMTLAIVGVPGQVMESLASSGEMMWFELGMITMQVLLFSAVAAAVVAGIVWSDLGIPRHRVHRVMIEEDRCPCCGLTFESGECEDDGCATCGNCGAGWRIVSASPHPSQPRAERFSSED